MFDQHQTEELLLPQLRQTIQITYIVKHHRFQVVNWWCKRRKLERHPDRSNEISYDRGYPDISNARTYSWATRRSSRSIERSVRRFRWEIADSKLEPNPGREPIGSNRLVNNLEKIKLVTVQRSIPNERVLFVSFTGLFFCGISKLKGLRIIQGERWRRFLTLTIMGTCWPGTVCPLKAAIAA